MRLPLPRTAIFGALLSLALAGCASSATSTYHPPTATTESAVTATPSATPARAITPSTTRVPSTPTRSSSPGIPGALRVSGSHLVNASGATVRLRGVNYSGAEYACIQGWGIWDGPSDDAMIAAIASWHANTVRVLLNEDCWLGINGVQSQYGGAVYQKAIGDFIAKLAAHGLYAEVSLIWTAPGQTQATDQSPMPDADHSLALWSSLASSLKNTPTVIFGAYGEPHDIDWLCWRDGGSACSVGYRAAGMQSIVNAIRGAGARQPITVSGIDWANNLSQWLQYRPSDPLGQLVAEFHQYGDNTCNDATCWNAQLAPVAAQAPLLTSELGESVDGTCSSQFINSYMSWADAHGVGYLGWTWDTWGNCESLITDFNGTPTQGFGQGFKAHLMTS